MTKQSRTTYIKTSKLRKLVNESELSKKEIIRQLSIPEKTLQRAMSLTKQHTVNKDIVSALAEFFKINYEDLIDTKKEKNTSDINRIVLNRIWDVRQFTNLIRCEYIKKTYDINLNSSNQDFISSILETIYKSDYLTHQNKRKSNLYIKEDFENELDYVKTVSAANDSINNLLNKNIGIFIGYWQTTGIFPNLIFGSEGPNWYWKPDSVPTGMLLFSYCTKFDNGKKLEYSQKIIYPNKGFSRQECANVYKHLLDNTKNKKTDYIMKHFFPWGISAEDYEDNYRDIDKSSLPSADYNEKTRKYANGDLLVEANNPFFGMDRPYHGKIVPVTDKDFINKKKEDDM